MEHQTSNNPAQELAERLAHELGAHPGDTLCFLAGGSAFEIFEYLELDENIKRRTIFCMGDERVSGNSAENNYLQLLTKLSTNHGLQLIDTASPGPETPKQFTERINKIISEKLFTLIQPNIICVLGVGTDGHTAGIFPMQESSFATTYPNDSMYVPITTRGLESNFRASLTPDWILSKADLVLGYATGEIKCKTVIRELCNRNYEIHEMPAQIIKRHKNSILFTDCV